MSFRNHAYLFVCAALIFSAFPAFSAQKAATPAAVPASPPRELNASQAGQSATPPPLIAPQSAQTNDASEKWPEGAAGDAAKAYSSGDLQRARAIWEELASKGDGQAMNNLGVLYDQGKGAEPDPGRALHWFAQSANAGNTSGMNNYGRFLQQGRGGIPANPEEAARWFDLAARQGQPEAQYNLGFLYETGQGVPRDEAAAAAWYSRAASLRQKDALARLGHFYRIGKGVAPNSERAALLLYAAAMEGSTAAIAELRSMAKGDKASASLFGQPLDKTDRDKMREALKKVGAKAKREDEQHICDVYEGTNIIPGAGEMAICYGPDKRLAFLKIDYIANDKNRADAVANMVEKRFGEPTAGEGEDARLWNLGSVIVATQYAPTYRQMSLMYMIPEVYHLTQAD